jgi:hypothetical protein
MSIFLTSGIIGYNLEPIVVYNMVDDKGSFHSCIGDGVHPSVVSPFCNWSRDKGA